jgi:hypothetical protein
MAFYLVVSPTHKMLSRILYLLVFIPRRIGGSSYDNGRTLANKLPELLLGGNVIFEYSSFRRFDVTSPDASLNPTARP